MITVSVDPRVGLRRLRVAAESSELSALCADHQIKLLVVFGSVLDSSRRPQDLDIAVAFEPRVVTDLLQLVHDLVQLAGTENVDVMDLGRAGPVARERALIGTTPLFESEPGAFTRTQMAAITERMETAPLRQLDLELLAQ